MLQVFIDGVTAQPRGRPSHGLRGDDSLRLAIGNAKEVLLKARLGANTAQSGGVQSDSERCAEEAFALIMRKVSFTT